MASIPHAWLSLPDRTGHAIYIAHVCTGACSRGSVHFRRNMPWNDKEYLDSQEKYQGIGNVVF